MRKNITSKMLAILLALVMAFSVVPVAFAADEVVLFEDNFETLTEGSMPTTGKAWNQWTGHVKSDTTYGKAVKDGDSTVINFSNTNPDKKGGPRLEKMLNVSSLTNLTLSYRVMSSGVGAMLQVWADGEAKGSGSAGSVVAYSKSDWATIKVVFDIKTLKYTVETNGKKSGEGTLAAIKDLSTFRFRFAQTLSVEASTCLDDVKITTTDKVDPTNLTGSVSAGSSATTGANIDATSGAVVMVDSMTNKPTAVRALGSNVLFEDDAEGYGADGKIPTGAANQWSAYTQGTNAVAGIIDNGGNKVISYGNPTSGSTYPRIEKSLEYNGLKTLHIQFAVKPHGASFYLELISGGVGIGKIIQSSSKEDWLNYELALDVVNSKYAVKLNGAETVSMQDLPAKIGSPSSLIVRFNWKCPAGKAVYLDNVVISTPDNVTSAQIMLGNEGEIYHVNFDNVKMPNPDMAVGADALRAHPRIFVTDWQAMRDKVKSTPEFESWYGRIKAQADKMLTGKTEEFIMSSTGNILGQARNLYKKMAVLGFVYNIEQNPIYAERAWTELDATNNFPHWSASDAYLATAEMSYGYAIAYDWFFDAFTREQKDTMIAALKEKCLGALVYNYEGKQTSTNFTSGTTNWNNVCNGSSAILALSMYEEFPELAEYILQKAMTFIPNGLKPYAPEGAYAEGTMYWGLGTNYTVRMAAAVDSAFKNPADIPEKYILYNTPGLEQTPDFPVYYSAYTGAFNFGDAAGSKAGSDTMYWFASKFNKSQYAWYQRNYDYENGGPSSVLGFVWYDGNAEAVPGAFKLDRAYYHETAHNGVSMRSSWEDDKGLFISMMGAYNRTNHQYLANGTFMLEANGLRWITMRGAGSYSYDGYFGSKGNDGKRWTYYQTRGEAQNTIIANPTALADQESEAVGHLINSGSATNEAFGIFDITQTNKAFKSAKRGAFLFDNRSKVLIQDEITTSTPSEIYWFAHTPADITISEDGKSAFLEMKGEKMLVRIIEGPAEARISVYDSKPLITSPAPQEQSLSFGKKLAIHLTNVTSLHLAVEFIPLAKEEGIPAPSQFKKLDDWKVEESEMLLDAKLGDAIALFLNSPVAHGGGRKMYVDANNYGVVPFTENGRTLVPVRFIAESFGADVGWDDATQTVSVDYLGRAIRMQIGSNVMTVNGEEKLLDVPANTYNSRTLIPLRVLSEALGKKVLWDDRGLIIIDDEVAAYESMKDEIIDRLDYRITLDGAEMTMFAADTTEYNVSVSPNAVSAPVVGFTSVSGKTADIVQAAVPNGKATVTVAGKTYTLNFVPNTFEVLPSDKDAPSFAALNVKFAGETEPPAQPTYIEAKCIAQSGGESYALTNTVDNDLTSRWSASGEQWIAYDLGYEQQVGGFALATMNASTRAYIFDLQYSNDGENWTTFYSDKTKMQTDMPDQFSFTPIQARYIRVLGHGADNTNWNSYTEVRFYTDAAQAALDAANFSYYYASGDFSGKPGESGQLLLDCRTIDGTPIDMSEAKVRYNSVHPEIATVDASGKVTLKAPGIARIGIEVTYGDYTKLESKYVECK